MLGAILLFAGYTGLEGLNTPHSCPANTYCVAAVYPFQIAETFSGFFLIILGSGIILLTKRTIRRIVSFGAIIALAIIILFLFGVQVV